MPNRTLCHPHCNANPIFIPFLSLQKLVVRKCIPSFSRCLPQFCRSPRLGRFDLSGQLCQSATSFLAGFLLRGQSYPTANFHSSTENAAGSSAVDLFKVQQRLHDDDLSLFTQRFPLTDIYRFPDKNAPRMPTCSGLPWIFIV